MASALTDGHRATDRPAGARPRAGRVLLVHQPTDGGVGRHVAISPAAWPARPEVRPAGPARPEGLSAAASPFRRLDLRRPLTARGPAAAARLAGIVRELRPGLVHAHSSKAGAVARLARARHPRVPLVYSPHLYAFAGHFERGGERFAYRAFEMALAPAATRVVCVCESEARARTVGGPRTARARGPQRRRRRETMLPPTPRLAALAGEGPLVGVVSHLQPRKGLECC